MLATAAPAVEHGTPGWLQGEETAKPDTLLDDSWLNPSARRANDVPAEAPEWLRRDELEASVAPAAAAPDADTAQNPDELPDWLRDIADESRQRLEARAQEPVPAADEAPPAAQPSPTNQDDIPDWLREIKQEAPDATAGDGVPATAAVDDTPPWLQDQAAAQPAPQAGVVEGELVAVEVTQADGAADAGTAGTAAGEGDPTWAIDDGSALGTSFAAGAGEETHARVYDVPDNSIWSAQPDRPAPDGSTGQQTAIWTTPDETARAIVPQSETFLLPSWLEDDDIEPAGRPAPGAWSPPTWLEDSDIDAAPARQTNTGWTPPTWLDDDDATLPAPGRGKGAPSWLAEGGGVAVAGAAVAAARPAETQSAELLQRLLSEPATEPAVTAQPSRGGGTMLIVILVVLLVMAALVFVFLAPAFGLNFF